MMLHSVISHAKLTKNCHSEMKRLHENAIKPPKRLLQPADTRHFVKIIHKKKPLLKVAFWKRRGHALMACQSHRFVIDIKSKWVYSHIKLSSYFRYVLFQVITQFDLTANPP
jgi:hypothetical protein